MAIKRYVHTTIISPAVKIRRERLLPKAGEVVVRINQEVSAMQVVARAPQETPFRVIAASDILKIPSEELSKYLLVERGSAVEEGTPLFRKRGRLRRRRTVNSPIDGSVYDISNGHIVLQQTPDWLELRAMVQAHVTNHIANQGVILETYGGLIQAVWGSGKDSHGKIKVATSTNRDIFTADLLTPDTTGRILVAGRIDQADTLKKAEENGIRGVITGSLPADLCETALSLAFPVLVTDGIGDQMMASPIFRLLQQYEEQEASLFGRHSDRLGNRPEVIIPLADKRGVASSPTYGPLSVGQTVRILREPYSNQVGEVDKIYQYAQTTMLKTRVHGADVKLLDGRVVFVPFENLDAII